MEVQDADRAAGQGSDAYDVVIAGGGVGGIALGTRLGRQGYRVVIVERAEFGEFRVGESLDWEAPVYLERLGLALVQQWLAEGKATEKGGAASAPRAAEREGHDRLLIRFSARS